MRSPAPTAAAGPPAAVPLALVAAVLLVLAAVPLPVLAEPASTTSTSSTLDYTRSNLSGDTYAFTLNSKSAGQPFTIQAGSTISVDAVYPGVRDDFALAFAFTDLQETAREALFYGTFQTSPGLRVELLSHSVGPEVQVTPRTTTGSTDRIGWDLIFDEAITFPDRDWHFAVSTPEAAVFDVHVDLSLDTDVDLLGEGTAGAGLVASTDDFDGAAQVEMNGWTAAAGMHALAEAPSGTRAFAVLLPMDDRGAGSYGVDGPGGNDHRVVAVSLSSSGPGPAFVLTGPPGTYRHYVTGEVWQHTTTLDGRAAVFFAAPIPP